MTVAARRLRVLAFALLASALPGSAARFGSGVGHEPRAPTTAARGPRLSAATGGAQPPGIPSQMNGCFS